MRSRISQLMGVSHFHNSFHWTVQTYCGIIHNQVEYKFDLMLSTDGSGRGAALVAAVLKSQEKKI